MPTYPFIANGIPLTVRGVALGGYRPLFLKVNGEKIRNPAFDDHSQHILNLKSPEKGWFNGSLKYCAKIVKEHLATMQGFDRAQIVIIPSSVAGKHSIGLEKIAQAVCSSDNRFHYRQGALVRTRTIEKLAKGGARSQHVHLQSLQYRPHQSDSFAKIILDDVCTSANSIGASLTIIYQTAGPFDPRPVTLGKTTHD